MAKDIQTKKRKASEPEAEIEKLKKVKKAVPPASDAPPKKRKAAEEAAPATVKKTKTPKSAVEVPERKSTRNIKAAENPASSVVAVKVPKASKQANGASAKTKGSKTVKSTERLSASDEEDEQNNDDDDDDSEIDDQTEALLQGFESEGDEEDADTIEGLKDGQKVPKVPKLDKIEKKKLDSVVKGEEKPGVVYVGRIPHGFYEHEMKEYFKQFGNILKLRLSRNRKTGASKHYAFIQFESATVADIVSRTMDNYLLFGHILKVKTVAEDQIPESVWKGANRRFKKVPWNKIEGRKLELGASEDDWEVRREKEEKRRVEKAEKLKAIGYEFEAPKIKSAKGLAKKKPVTNGDAEILTIEAAPAVEEPSKSKKKGKANKQSETIGAALVVTESSKPKKNEKKAKQADPVTKADEAAEDVAIVPADEVELKQKKAKKQKADAPAESLVPAEPVEKKLKSKRSKAALADEAVPAETVPEVVKKVKRAKK